MLLIKYSRKLVRHFSICDVRESQKMTIHLEKKGKQNMFCCLYKQCMIAHTYIVFAVQLLSTFYSVFFGIRGFYDIYKNIKYLETKKCIVCTLKPISKRLEIFKLYLLGEKKQTNNCSRIFEHR